MSEKCERCEKELETMKGLYLCLKMIKQAPEYKNEEMRSAEDELFKNIRQHDANIKGIIANRSYEILADYTAEKIAEGMKRVTYDFILEEKEKGNPKMLDIEKVFANNFEEIENIYTGRFQSRMAQCTKEKIDTIIELGKKEIEKICNKTETESTIGRIDCPCELYEKLMGEIEEIKKKK